MDKEYEIRLASQADIQQIAKLYVSSWNRTYQGIIPQSYQLCRLSEDGSISVIARGVIAYALSGDDLYYSNGKAIIKLSSDGKSEKVCSADKVTFISIY